jgi:hypothetical protein
MTKLSIEINDQSFLIRLNKEEFNYKQVKRALEHLLNWSMQDETSSFEDKAFHDGEWNSRFDQLSDK